MGALLGALVVVTLAVAPATAAPTKWRVQDARGDAAPRADIWASNVTWTDTRYVVTTRIANLFGYGTYTFEFRDDFRYPGHPYGPAVHYRVVVSKALGDAPEASVARKAPGGSWVRTACTPGVVWDVTSEIVSASVPKGCPGVDPSSIAEFGTIADVDWVSFSAGGAADTARVPQQPVPGERHLEDARGDTPVGTDLLDTSILSGSGADWLMINVDRLRDWGTYDLALNADETTYELRVVKRTGQPPQAVLTAHTYDGSEVVACAMQVRWSTDASMLTVQLPGRCFGTTWGWVPHPLHQSLRQGTSLDVMVFAP